MEELCAQILRQALAHETGTLSTAQVLKMEFLQEMTKDLKVINMQVVATEKGKKGNFSLTGPSNARSFNMHIQK